MAGEVSQALPVRVTTVGLDTKSDELLTTGMLALENVVFDRPGGLRKRNGYAINPSFSATDRSLIASVTELLAVATNAVATRVVTPSPKWSQKGNRPWLYNVTETQVAAPAVDASVVLADTATLNGIAVHAWLEYNPAAVSNSYATVIDLATGSEILAHARLSQSATQGPDVGPRCVIIGQYIDIWVAHDTTAIPHQRYRIDTLNPPVTLPAPTTVVMPAASEKFALASDGTNGFFVQYQGTNLRLGALPMASTGGVIVATPSGVSAVDLTMDAAGNLYVAWVENASGTYSYCIASYTQALAVRFARTVLGGPATGTGGQGIAIAVPAYLGTGVLYYETQQAGRPQTVVGATFNTTTGGIIAFVANLPFYEIGSRIAVSGARTFLWVVTQSTPLANGVPAFATMLLYCHDTGEVAARAMYQTAFDKNVNTIGYYMPNGMVALADGTLLCAAPRQARLFGTSQGVRNSIVLVTFAPKQAVTAAALNGSSNINSSMVQSYDGRMLVEHGFHHQPDVPVSSSQATTGGTLSNGTYLVQVVYQWADDNGELQMSAPSQPFSITLTGNTSTQRFSVGVRPYSLTTKRSDFAGTLKNDVRAIVYRTIANGPNLYAATSVDLSGTPGADGYFVANLGATGAGDSVIASRETIYTNAGTVPNDPAPHTNFLMRAGDRLWAHAGNGVLWPSKKRIVGRAVEWSSSLTYQLSTFTDPIAMAELASKRYLVFSPTQVAAFQDSGTDSLGNPIFSDDEVLLRTTGCNDPLSVANFPGGVIFRTDRGWWSIADSLDDEYIGAPVEAYNGYDVAGVVVLAKKNRIVITLRGTGAPTLVYDTLMKQWSVDKNAVGVNAFDAKSWRGIHTVLDGNGYLWSQTDSTFVDYIAPVVMRLRSGFIAPQGPQGAGRFQALHFKGKKRSDHKLYVLLRFDGEETVAETHVCDAGPTFAGEYRWKVEPTRQICESVSFEIYDDFSGLTPGEGYSLSDVEVEFISEAVIATVPGVHVATRIA